MSPTPTLSVEQAYELALQHHHARRFAEAEVLYRQILAQEPRHAEASHLIGLIAHEYGRHELAIDLIRRAIAVDPRNVGAHCNLGEVYRVVGRLGEAEAVLRRALTINPNRAEVHNNLGTVLRDQQRLPEAEEELCRCVQLKPDYAKAYSNLGIVVAESGRIEDSIGLFRHSLELEPGQAEVYNNLGNALKHHGVLSEAVAVFERALQLHPSHCEIQNNYGTTLIEQGRLDEAEAVFRRVLELQPNHARAQNNLGNTFKDRGMWDAAIPAYRRALEMKPDYWEARSNLVYTLLFHPRQDYGEIAYEQRLWNREVAEPLKRSARLHENNRDPARRLRLGYMSPDLWGHVVGRNLLPLFRFHDREQFEIICYSGVVRPDYFTEEFRQHADRWYNTLGVSDETLAETIRRDGVDILVDLSQHMANNSLPVFARQPAPVQASFAGYPESTGVAAIPYRISDRHLESQIEDRRLEIGVESKTEADLRSPSSELRPSERVFLLDSFWCYDAGEVEIPINPLPAKKVGHVTFGCLNSFCKVNEPLLRLWARVLHAVPGSRLLLLIAAGSPRERTASFLQGQGIGPERLEFVDRCPHHVFLAWHHRVDIALDPFPYNGHTTSLDALWMGVPVVTLASEHPVSRAGLSQLSNLNLSEFVAFSEDDYVSVAKRAAGNLPWLAELRRTLRSRMQASVITDAVRFTRGIETAFRLMWRQCCRSPG
jgi:predicted O-linked N-acetylglucosamine transferase (SPINDLY family)